METLRALREAISEVLETMCFLCPVPVKAAPPERPSYHQWHVTEMDFSGDFTGRMRLHFPGEVVDEMASSFLGKPREELRDEEVRDVLLEVTNIVGGGLLERLDPRATTRMSLPREAQEGSSWEPSAGVALDLEGLMILGEIRWMRTGK